MIYVGKNKYKFKSFIMSHLVADSIEELHKMAQILDLKRSWFQDGKRLHYDISQTKKKQAIKLGAIEINDRQIIKLFNNK